MKLPENIRQCRECERLRPESRMDHGRKFLRNWWKCKDAKACGKARACREAADKKDEEYRRRSGWRDGMLLRDNYTVSRPCVCICDRCVVTESHDCDKILCSRTADRRRWYDERE